MPRVIIVVARNRPALFEYFERMFAGISDIRVMLDRRVALPAPILPAADPDRRKRQEIYDDLQQRGFVIVRLS